jgi:WD40 repeat protein
MIKGNPKYTAFLWGSGGIVCVLDNNKPTKIPMDQPMIKGHQGTTMMYSLGSILDLDWYPFDDSFIATSSMDNTIKLWKVPEPFN